MLIHHIINSSTITHLVLLINNYLLHVTHQISIKLPLPTNYFIIKIIINTRWYPIDCIIATHDTTHTTFLNTGSECWEIGLRERERERERSTLFMRHTHTLSQWYRILNLYTINTLDIHGLSHLSLSPSPLLALVLLLLH